MGRVSSFWDEFRRFAVKGNALELAVAVVVGNAFTQIVNSLVGDIITPLMGMIPGAGNSDFKNAAIVLRPATTTAHGTAVPALLLRYGSFLSAVFNFIVVSLSIFLIFKFFSVMRRRFFVQEQKTPAYEKPAQERLLEEIRDLLKKQTAQTQK